MRPKNLDNISLSTLIDLIRSILTLLFSGRGLSDPPPPSKFNFVSTYFRHISDPSFTSESCVESCCLYWKLLYVLNSCSMCWKLLYVLKICCMFWKVVVCVEKLLYVLKSCCMCWKLLYVLKSSCMCWKVIACVKKFLYVLKSCCMCYTVTH